MTMKEKKFHPVLAIQELKAKTYVYAAIGTLLFVVAVPFIMFTPICTASISILFPFSAVLTQRISWQADRLGRSFLVPWWLLAILFTIFPFLVALVVHELFPSTMVEEPIYFSLSADKSINEIIPNKTTFYPAFPREAITENIDEANTIVRIGYRRERIGQYRNVSSGEREGDAYQIAGHVHVIVGTSTTVEALDNPKNLRTLSKFLLEALLRGISLGGKDSVGAAPDAILMGERIHADQVGELPSSKEIIQYLQQYTLFSERGLRKQGTTGTPKNLSARFRAMSETDRWRFLGAIWPAWLLLIFIMSVLLKSSTFCSNLGLPIMFIVYFGTPFVVFKQLYNRMGNPLKIHWLLWGSIAVFFPPAAWVAVFIWKEGRVTFDPPKSSANRR